MGDDVATTCADENALQPGVAEQAGAVAVHRLGKTARRLSAHHLGLSIMIRMIALLMAIGIGATTLTGGAEPLPVTLPVVEVVATNFSPDEIVQPIPQAVTVLSGESLQLSGQHSVAALARRTPGFSQSHAGLRSFSDNYFIRGIGNTDFLGDPGVVVYVDDAPFGDAVTFAPDLFAIDWVEVFRGPQVTRFGKNAPGGVINIRTRQPANKTEATASASYATFNSQQYQARASIPLVNDKLFLGLAGQYRRSDGFIKNIFLNRHADERESINGRAIARWIPTEDWEVDFNGALDRYEDGFGLTSLSGSPRQTASEFNPGLEEKINGQSLRILGAMSEVTVTAITARREFDLDPLTLDPDFSALTGNTGVVRNAQTQWSQEVRLAPTVIWDQWNWHLGLFFSTLQARTIQDNSFFIPPGGPGGRDVIDFRQDSQNYAVFGEVARQFAQKFEATVGLRFDYAERAVERTRQPPFGPPLAPIVAEEGFFNCAPKFTLAYHASDRVQVYASTGLGFKPGGYSGYIDPPQSPQFETERNWASEIGVKSTWLEERLVLNASLFYYAIRDYQVEQFVPVGFDFTIVNAPRATSLGGEIEFTYRPRAGWELGGCLGYADTRLDTYTDPFTGVTVRDTYAPNVALFNAGLWGQYQHASGLVGRIDYALTGDTYYDAANRTAFKRNAFGIWSAQLGFEHDNFGVFVFGENLTDERYYSKKIVPLNAGAPGQPRTIGVMVSLKY